MKIRSATLGDAGLLAELNVDVQRLHAQKLPHLFKQPHDLGIIAATFRDVFLANPDMRVYVVEVEDVAAGYIVAQITCRPENAFTYEQKTVYIDQISVRPAYQRQGCGQALIQAVFDLARSEGIERVTLATWDFNTDAQAFFKKQGFNVYHYRMDVTLEG